MLIYSLLFYVTLQLGIWSKRTNGQPAALVDSRCYLEGGGSAESFLASEDVAIGSVIGTLRINGDPKLDSGDIKLSLRERDAPVAISPGTKELVLITPLDKEGIRGPSSVYVNVICDRQQSSDPSFVIPVNIRVTDVNDNAPQWVGHPYTLSLSEVTVTGTRILQGARAIDQDQQGAFSTVEYQVLPGPHSDYVAFVTPLDGTLVLRKPLDYEALKNFTIKLRAQDQGTPPKFSDTILRVIITDADDQNPKFLKDNYSGELPLDGTTGELNIYPELIKALDQDEGLRAPLQYSIIPSIDSKYFSINPKNGLVSLVTPLGPADLQNAITLVIKATQLDNSDRYALTTLIISRKGARQMDSPLQFIQTKFQAKIREDLGMGSRILALPTNKPGKYLRYYIPDKVQAQFFSFGTLGELILRKSLDYETITKHTFQVLASDGTTNATTEVTIEILDVNDWEPRFRQTHYEFNVAKPFAKNDEPVAIGKLEAADGDRNDKISLNLKGQMAEYFSIDQRGMLWLKGERPNNLTVAHLVVTATDTGVPQKTSSVPVTVTMDGFITAYARWIPGVLGALGVVLGLFIMVVIAMSAYIYKNKKHKGSRNRVHSHNHSTTSGANLMNHDKPSSGLHLTNGNLSLGNPMNGHGGSGSSLSAGASTILAASLEREAQRERERETYTATVRSIISRASRNGRVFDEDIERDSISNDTVRTTWNALQEHGKDIGSAPPSRSKKLSWDNAGADENNHIRNNNNINKTDAMGSTDVMGSTENNLTVYF